MKFFRAAWTPNAPLGIGLLLIGLLYGTCTGQDAGWRVHPDHADEPQWQQPMALGYYEISLNQPAYRYEPAQKYTAWGWGYDQWGRYQYGLVDHYLPARKVWVGRASAQVQVWQKYRTRQGLTGWRFVCDARSGQYQVQNPGRPLVWTNEMINSGSNLR